MRTATLLVLALAATLGSAAQGGGIPRTSPAGPRTTPLANQGGAVPEVFVTSSCPYCRALESALTARGVPYRRRDVEHDPDAREAYHRLGGSGFPTTRIGNRIIVGNKLDAILAALGRRL